MSETLIHSLPESTGAVALTFDDGPDPRFTRELLEILVSRDATATFFVLGQAAVEHPEVIAELREANMGIAVHSWDHEELVGANAGIARDQLSRTVSLLESMDAPPTLFRPPFGEWSEELVEIAAELGLWTVLWSIDTMDWDWPQPPVEEVVLMFELELHPGAVVLLHDGGVGASHDRQVTIDALPAIIDEVTNAGLSFADLASALGPITPRS